MAFNFTDKLVNDGNCTLIVDALNLAFRWKHQGRTDFRYEYQRTVQSLAKSYDCKNIIITADLGSSSYRKEINPDYKQNRKEKFAEQSEQEKMVEVLLQEDLNTYVVSHGWTHPLLEKIEVIKEGNVSKLEW